jgi:3-hydroxyacyl-[acyl-carrier-protein] dehydratase
MKQNDRYREALAALPHGPEFRFIDQLTELQPGRSGAGQYRIRGDEPFLVGHFPGNPMMPGVLMVEAIAQLGGVVAQCDPDHPPLEELRLGGVRSAKILGSAKPGETLEIRAEIEGRMGGLVQIRGEVRGPGGPLATAMVVLSGSVVAGNGR